MSDRWQNSLKTIVSVAKDLTVVMNVAVVDGQSFAKWVNANDARNPGFVPVKPKGWPKNTPVLSPVRQANTSEERAILLTLLMSKRFALLNSATKKLHI